MKSKFKIKFNLNPLYVFLFTINTEQEEEPFKGWADFTNKIWEEDSKVFLLLAGAAERVLFIKNKIEYKNAYARKLKMLAKIKKAPEYKRLIKESKKYLRFVKTQWRKNEKRATSLLQELSGLPLPQHTVTVNITHPKLRNGVTFDDKNIVWGHSEDFRNYSTVYICHEILHIMTKNNNSDIFHAVIELLADNEIRIRLNKKGRYFQYDGNKYLKRIERNLLP